MAFQISPGVNVSEIDASLRVSPVSTSDAAIAAGFQWGPSNQITTVSSESEMATIFGKPDGDTAANWLTAASFLAYSGALQVIRTVGTDAKNATSGVGTVGAISSVDFDTQSAPWQASQTHPAVVVAGGAGDGRVTITTDAQGDVTSVVVTTAGTGYEEGDSGSITDPHSGTSSTIVLTVDTVVSTGTAPPTVANEDAYDAGALDAETDAFIARYPGVLGNSLEVKVLHQGGFSGWDSSYMQNGKQTNVSFEAIFDRAPDTSNYVLTKNGNIDVNDEVHVVVVDGTGDISGVAGTVLEKYAHLSLATDAKGEEGSSIYIKDVIRRESKYIYATGDFRQIHIGWNSDNTSTTTTAFTDVTIPYSVRLAGGAGANTTDSTAANADAARYDLTNNEGYALLRDTDVVDVGIIISGDASITLQQNLIDNVAEHRKDAIVVVSPENGTAKTAIISASNSNSEKAAALGVWVNSGNLSRSSSYAVADSGYKRMYDAHNDVYRNVPLNGDIAGLMVRTDQTNDAWWSPAGFTRGNVKNVVKLHFNPDKASRDTIYKLGINPVVSMPGSGTILYGDKTLYAKPSAFDRINVRRLFVVLEKSISRAAKNLLFEFNDEFTRSSFRNMVEPFLRDIKARRGVYDYKVVCDSTNNTAEVIDRNEFVGDIYIKPARSINFIQLNFVAVRTGVDFSEVIGTV